MVDFTYYSTTYKGQLSSARFAILEPKAEDEITLLIGRVLTATELALTNVKQAICYMTDYEDIADRGLSSESLGSYSYTLDNGKNNELYRKAMQFLILAGIYSRSVIVC